MTQFLSILGALFPVPVVVFMHFTMRRQDAQDEMQKIINNRLDVHWREIDATIERVSRLERKRP